MSTSVKNDSYVKAARRYGVAAAGCAAFALIYAQFSHGVHSPFMTFMFAVPLLAGAVFAAVLHAVGAPAAPRATRQAWALAVASLTVASCLRGVFDIAGTSSPLLVAYLVAAAAFALVAAVGARKAKREQPAH